MANSSEEEILAIASRAGILAGQGKLNEARAFLAPAIQQLPPHPHLWHNWAQVLADLGQIRESEVWFRDIIQRWPGFLPAYATLVRLIRYRMGVNPTSEAIADLVRILNNQGNAIQSTGDYLKASGCYREALILDENYANAWANLSNSLRPMGLVSEAESCARKALALDPTHVGAWNNLGCALTDQGRVREAEIAFAQGLKIDPHHAPARHNAGSGRLFNLLFLESLDNEAIHKAHTKWGEELSRVLANRPAPRATPAEKVRVGFLSADFRYHAMAHFVVPLLENLDRDRFELFCYANQRKFDSISMALRSLPLSWREIADLPDDQCAQLIQDDHLDLLVDLSGHTDGHRANMLAMRPAPTIATWLGYMSTTGNPAIDFRITDRWTDPEYASAGHHSECLAYLEGSQFVFRPEAKAPPVQSTPALKNGFITFGSLNNARKLSLSAIRTWADLLRQIPDSRLILQAKLFADLGTVGYFRGLFEAFGIDFDRIELRAYAHEKKHLLTYHEIDIALDPFPYSGGATTCDALWMGVPVVTLSGNRSVGRMGVSILNGFNYPEWIAATHKDYISIASELATDFDRLNQIRLGLREKLTLSPLRDEAGFARNFGDLLVSMARTKWHN